jgi:hypothetical protein
MIDFLICGQIALRINLSVYSIDGILNVVISRTLVIDVIYEAVD